MSSMMESQRLRLRNDLEVARIGDSEPRASWRFAGSAEAYPRDDLGLEGG
jgi:hypothetical protein